MDRGRWSHDEPPTIAVVGAGAAGTLATASLLRTDPTCRVALVDPAERPGPGLAYGTEDGAHLLNVRAGRMSAFTEDPDHFVDWLASRGTPVASTDFVPRVTYGEYLTDLLASAATTGRLHLHRARAVDVVQEPTGTGTMSVRTTPVAPPSGGSCALGADAVVLALGNGAPSALPWEVDHRAEPWCVADPWAPGVLGALPPDGPVLLVGTGLTAVDVALTLCAAGRRVVAVSRRGLLPTSHLVGPEPVWPTTVPSGAGPLRVRELLASMRTETASAASAGVDWRAVVDGLRPAVQGLWARLSEPERRTFLAHVARHWDVHRHRMAPEVARRVATLLHSGALAVRHARPVDAGPDGAGARVRELAPDGTTAWRHYAAVVNCTGPNPDPTRPPSPLVDALLARGTVRPDPLRLGFDVTAAGNLVDRAGRANDRLAAIGSLRRGNLWESTAVPELRRQAADLATALTRRAVHRPG